MEALEVLVICFSPAAVDCRVCYLRYGDLALLGSLLTFRSIANGLYASAKRVRA